MSLSKIVKSANLPTSIVPLISSSKDAIAGHMVNIFNASNLVNL